jgi:hypothetical protein
MVILIRLIASRWAIQRLARRARSVTDPLWIALLDECTRLMRVERPVRLLRSDEHVMPMTLGTRIPTIVIPAIADLWDDERRRAVLLHELAHVERRDCSTQLLASIACAVYWVHPGVWWAARRLRVERELACDDRVLTSGVRAHEYAGHLLELAYAAGGRRAPALVVAMARPRQLETRLRAAMDPERRRTVPGLRTSVAAIVLGAAVLLPLASVQAAATPSAPRARQNAAASPIPAPTRGSGQSTTEADADPLARARNHGVTPRYITEIRELGYESLPLDELIRARDHGITPGYIRDLRQLGYRMSMEDLLTARDHGIVPEYIAGLRALGYSDMPAADLIRLRDHGIVPEYVQELNALGYQRISRDDIVRLRDHGVTPDYVRKVKAYGYTNPTIDDLISLRDKGEPRDLWDRITDHLSRLTLRDLHNALLRLFDDAHLGVLGRHD